MLSRIWKWTSTALEVNKLDKGDVIKIGRFIFNILEISTESPDINLTDLGDPANNSVKFGEGRNSNTSNFENLQPFNNMPKKRQQDMLMYRINRESPKEDHVWRICLGDSSTDDDPFISPWSCSGTMKYIHFSCIKSWLNSKRSTKQGEYFYSIIWQIVKWELCKEEFKHTVFHNGKPITLLDYEKPKSNNWVVLEAVNTETLFDDKIKIYHVFDFKDLDTLTVGRGHASNAKISDISISRLHAYFKLVNNDIWIEDADSKFGWLYLQKTPFTLKQSSDPLYIQVGRTYIEIKYKKQSRSNCCTKFWIKRPKMIVGKDFQICPEDFPEELQKLYYSRETRLNQILQDSLGDPHDFYTSNERIRNSFLLSPQVNPRSEFEAEMLLKKSEGPSIIIKQLKTPSKYDSKRLSSKSNKSQKSSSPSEEGKNWHNSSCAKLSNPENCGWDENIQVFDTPKQALDCQQSVKKK